MLLLTSSEMTKIEMQPAKRGNPQLFEEMNVHIAMLHQKHSRLPNCNTRLWLWMSYSSMPWLVRMSMCHLMKLEIRRRASGSSALCAHWMARTHKALRGDPSCVGRILWRTGESCTIFCTRSTTWASGWAKNGNCQRRSQVCEQVQQVHDLDYTLTTDWAGVKAYAEEPTVRWSGSAVCILIYASIRGSHFHLCSSLMCAVFVFLGCMLPFWC